MKRILLIVLFTCFIFLGMSLIVFVVSMFKVHTDSMGKTMEIMMGKEMIYDHLITWIKQMFWVFPIIIGIVMTICLIKRR